MSLLIVALHKHPFLHYCSHVPLGNLRKALHVKLLLNLCAALVGLYVTFIISTVSMSVPVLCGVVSALMHYFFLAVFFWMAAEAIHLHRKLVSVFKPDIKSYILIAMAICWGRSIPLNTRCQVICILTLQRILPTCVPFALQLSLHSLWSSLWLHITITTFMNNSENH